MENGKFIFYRTIFAKASVVKESTLSFKNPLISHLTSHISKSNPRQYHFDKIIHIL